MTTTKTTWTMTTTTSNSHSSSDPRATTTIRTVTAVSLMMSLLCKGTRGMLCICVGGCGCLKVPAREATLSSHLRLLHSSTFLFFHSYRTEMIGQGAYGIVYKGR